MGRGIDSFLSVEHLWGYSPHKVADLTTVISKVQRSFKGTEHLSRGEISILIWTSGLKMLLKP